MNVGGLESRSVYVCCLLVILDGHLVNCLLLFVHVDGLVSNW